MVSGVGLKHVEFLPDIVPVLITALQDSTPAVARQSGTCGIDLFRSTLVRIAIQVGKRRYLAYFIPTLQTMQRGVEVLLGEHLLRHHRMYKSLLSRSGSLMPTLNGIPLKTLNFFLRWTRNSGNQSDFFKRLSSIGRA